MSLIKFDAKITVFRLEQIQTKNPQEEDKNIQNCEEIVEKILHYEKNEFQETLQFLRNRDLSAFKRREKYEPNWEERRKSYLESERWVRKNSDKIPAWKVAGSLNYFMSLEEMKEFINTKFKEMASQGKILTNKSISTQREFFYPPIGKTRDNLTRIWGADYLISNLTDSKTYNAAEHFLFVEDTESEIEVQVWHGNDYPNLLIVKNAQVLAKKIEGCDVGMQLSYSLKELGYRDFYYGNIICDSKNRINYVVDTEMNSFSYPKLDRDSRLANEYLKKRFKVLAGRDYDVLFQTFKISISDLIKN